MPKPGLSRQDRRKIRRNCIERGRKALERGLPDPLSEDNSLGIALVLRDRLLASNSPERASLMAADAELLLDRTLKKPMQGIEVGCRKGCSYCCSSVVTCTAPEIFNVARFLRGRDRGAAFDLAAVIAEGEARGALSAVDLLQQKRPCALLLAGVCGVYEARPIPCRQLYSRSADACRLAWTEGTGEVPVIGLPMDIGALVRTLMLAAVELAGLSDTGYDLVGALGAALTRPDCEARWLAGEEVFPGVRSAGRSAGHRGPQSRIVTMINALEA